VRERGRRAGWERAPSVLPRMASHIGGCDARASAGGDVRAVKPPGRGCMGCGSSGRGNALTGGAGGALAGRARSIPDPRRQLPGGRAGGIRADRWGHESKSVT
jgi:hypothetical protein